MPGKFIYNRGTYSLKSTSNYRFFEKFIITFARRTIIERLPIYLSEETILAKYFNLIFKTLTCLLEHNRQTGTQYFRINRRVQIVMPYQGMYDDWFKNNRYFKFFVKVFIYLSEVFIYLSISCIFSNPRNTSKTPFLISPTVPVSIFLLSPQS